MAPLEDSGDDDSIAAVIEAPDAVTIDMPATPDGGLTGAISIVYSQSEDAVVLQASDLPDPDEDHVYQLWAIRNGTPEASGTFEPDGGDVELYPPGLDPASAEAWAVTQEPDGGSDTPTLPILASRPDPRSSRNGDPSVWSVGVAPASEQDSGRAGDPDQSPATGASASGALGWSKRPLAVLDRVEQVDGDVADLDLVAGAGGLRAVVEHDVAERAGRGDAAGTGRQRLRGPARR